MQHKLEGMKIFQYMDVNTNKKVVLKRCKFGDDNLLNSLKNLDSPYIPKILDIVEMPDNPSQKGIIMKYVPSAVPISIYTMPISDPNKLLETCKQVVSAIKVLKEANLNCPEDNGEHYLVDNNNQFKFIDFDEPATNHTVAFSSILGNNIFYYNTDLYDELLNKYNLLLKKIPHSYENTPLTRKELEEAEYNRGDDINIDFDIMLDAIDDLIMQGK